MVKNPAANAGDQGLILGRGDPLEKEMATHSKQEYSSILILAWRIPWTEEPDRFLMSPGGRKESDMTEKLSVP